MKSVLFVDDEKHVLDGLRLALFERDDVWDMSFALGPEKALELMHKGPFDAVVSDLRMPSMDGAALLERARTLLPGAVRVILSGQADHVSVVRALAVAHQFLHKPCSAEVVFDTVQHMFDLRELMCDPRIEALIGRLEFIPSPPETYFELTRLMNKDDADANDFAAVIERDGALSAKVLQMANSAYFRSQREVTSIRQAVVHLGHEALRSMVLSSSLFGTAGPRVAAGFDLAGEQARAQALAQRARDLAPRADGETAFAAGLLHNLGRLAFAMGAPEAYERLLEEAAGDPKRIEAAERERFSVSREQVGAYLLGIWGLPGTLVEAVAYQSEPSRAPNPDAPTLMAVHAALNLPAASSPSATDDSEARLDPRVLSRPAWRDAISRWRHDAAAVSAA